MGNIPKKKILMHACCGPCSLEPYRILCDEGWDVTIYFSNDNIYPEPEFNKRYKTLLSWAKENNIEVISDEYKNFLWQKKVGSLGEYEPGTNQRIKRCSQCYAMRFASTAKYASLNGYDVIGTTLSVSPYQNTKEIKSQLENAAAQYNLESYFIDFRPYYSQATKQSKQLGMYRQEYCGCELSAKESIIQKEQREKQKVARAKEIEKEKAAAKLRGIEIQKHNAKKQRQKQLVKEYKQNH